MPAIASLWYLPQDYHHGANLIRTWNYYQKYKKGYISGWLGHSPRFGLLTLRVNINILHTKKNVQHQVVCPIMQYWISNWPITFGKTVWFAECNWSFSICVCGQPCSLKFTVRTDVLTTIHLPYFSGCLLVLEPKLECKTVKDQWLESTNRS